MIELLDKAVSVFVACAGAGMGLIRDLWATPGASAYFVGAAVPYAKEEVDRFLGFTPDSYCSAETAIDLAMGSYLRAARVGKNPVGVGVTAVVASKEIHRGDHRVHAAAIGPNGLWVDTQILTKGSGDQKRAGDDVQCSIRGEGVLRLASWLDCRYEPPPRAVDDAVLATHILAHPVFLHDGDRMGNLEDVAGLNDLVLLPGNFNPLHDGHVGMTDTIESVTGKRIVFEIDIHQPHKPAIPPADVLQRAARINSRGIDLLVTENLPLYIDKARRYPGVGFIIGADAARRMLDPKWGPNVDEMIGEFFGLGTRFYVFDRGNLKASDIVSPGRERLFIPVPGQWDISSTELRAASND